MNAKRIVFLTCFAAVTLTASAVTAGPRGGGGGMGRGSGGAHFSSMPARSGHTFARGTGTFSRNHRFSRNQFIFIGGFGYPFFYGYPYYGYYPYDYYGYGYGSYGSYSPYGNDYYGGSAYGYGYGNGDGDGNGNGSSVVELQRRLARAGYYHGAIDGIMGPATRRALRAYERTHNQSAYGMTDRY